MRRFRLSDSFIREAQAMRWFRLSDSFIRGRKLCGGLVGLTRLFEGANCAVVSFA